MLYGDRPQARRVMSLIVLYRFIVSDNRDVVIRDRVAAGESADGASAVRNRELTPVAKRVPGQPGESEYHSDSVYFIVSLWSVV